MKIINPTFGSDFEMFVENENGIIVPCPFWFGGSKTIPLDIGEGCARQRDGVLAEFNITPVNTVDDFIKYIEYCIKMGNIILGKRNHKLVPQSSHVFELEALTHKSHFESGCDPSFIAYLNGEKYKASFDDSGFRTSGFHIHIGFFTNQVNFNEFNTLMMLMDKYVGVPALEFDYDFRRRRFYGLPGEYRYKVIPMNDQYLVIIEYRTLSGNILRSPDYYSFVYNQTQLAIEAFNNGETLSKEDIDTNYKLILGYETYQTEPRRVLESVQ